MAEEIISDTRQAKHQTSAKSRNLIILNDNIKHFKHVPNLTFENWIER